MNGVNSLVLSQDSEKGRALSHIDRASIRAQHHIHEAANTAELDQFRPLVQPGVCACAPDLAAKSFDVLRDYGKNGRWVVHEFLSDRTM